MLGCRGRYTWSGLCTALVVLVAAAPASANSNKPYSLVISPQASLAGGASVQLTATFKNENLPVGQQLGSANLFWPTDVMQVTKASVAPPATATVSPSCTVGSVTGPCVQLRNLALVPGQPPLTVTMTATTPACSTASDSWTVEAKQANDFSGTGNDLALDTTNSKLGSALDGACKLTFGTQPNDALVNDIITSTPFNNPSGLPVTVRVEDASGHLVSGVTSPSGDTAPVTMALAKNPGNAVLSGTGPVAAVGGVATFSDLTLNRSGGPYELAASSGTGTLTGATSNSFQVQDTGAPCNEGQSCMTNAGTSNHDHAQVVAASGSVTGLLLESVNANNGARLTCSGYTSSDPNTYNVFTTVDRSKVVTLTFRPPPELHGNPNQILKAQQICFGAPYTFATVPGTPLVGPISLPDGTAGFIGLLPPCTGATVGPCHNRQQDTTVPDPLSPNGFDIVLVADIPAGLAGDPWME
jgi:hypothetical protein